MNCTGTLSFTASEDLGDLGTDQSHPVEYTWHWIFTAPVMVPWFILALTLILPKSNQQANSWKILIPIANVVFTWYIMLWALGERLFPASAAQQFETLILSLCIATAVMWLLSHTRSNQSGLTRFFKAVGILAAVSGLSMWCFMGYAPQVILLTFLITLTLLELSFVLGIVWTRRLCKKIYTPLRFTLCLLPCSMIMCILVTLLGYLTVYSFGSRLKSVVELTQLLLLSLMGGAIMGGLLYLVNLPFLILAMISPFYRERFQTYVDLKPKDQIQASQ